MSMLKITMSLQVLALNEMLSARMLAADEVDDVRGGNRLSDGSNHMELKTGRSESQKLAKSNGEKSKKLSKSGNSPNFDAIEAGPSFLTPEARAAINRLRLAFTKTLILRHFNLECHI